MSLILISRKYVVQQQKKKLALAMYNCSHYTNDFEIFACPFPGVKIFSARLFFNQGKNSMYPRIGTHRHASGFMRE